MALWHSGNGIKNAFTILFVPGAQFFKQVHFFRRDTAIAFWADIQQ
jgi:hypothetical protein